MSSRRAVIGMMMTAVAAVFAATPAAAEESDDVSVAMMCGSVYRVAAKQSKGMAAARAYDASHAMITELARLLDTTVEDEAVQSRMKWSDDIVAEMIAADDSLGDMVAECNEAHSLDVAVD